MSWQEKLFFGVVFVIAVFGFGWMGVSAFICRRVSVDVDKVVSIPVREVRNVFKGRGFDVVGDFVGFGFVGEVNLRVDNVKLRGEQVMRVRVTRWHCADTTLKWDFEFVGWE